MRRRLMLALAGFAALLAAPPLASAQEKMPVVASFSILGDFVSRVGGDRVAVTTLVGPNGDGHTFQPAPGDAKAVAAARVVFVNELGFEGWMPRLVKAAGSAAPVIETAAGIKPRPMADEEGDHDHGGIDPHVWQSVANAEAIVASVRDGLAAADPAGRAIYEANAGAYLAALRALDTDVKAAVASIPAERRRIITTHDAFGYFGAAYGVEFIAPQGVSTDSEVSARDIARIIRQVKAEAIPAVFLENISDPRLVQRIAAETGARIGGTLYSDALSTPEEGAGTYIDMMRHNIRELVGALAS